MERMIALALLLAAPPAAAQTGAPEAATADDLAFVPEAAAADDLAFVDVEERMTVPVRIADAGPYPFVIDTGAQRSVISRQLARRLALPPGRRVRVTAVAGSDEVETVRVPSLSVSTLGGTGIEAPALDARHLGALGMLGIDTLQGHALAIDFDRGSMAVAPATPAARRERALPGEIVIRARDLFGQLVVTNATIGGRRVRVVLDTGTSVSIGNLALRRLVAGRKAKEPAVFTSVLGKALSADYAVVPEMKLGEATIRSLPVAFADIAPFRAFGLEKRPALLLGMDALRLFRRVRIDFANRELRLTLPRG